MGGIYVVVMKKRERAQLERLVSELVKKALKVAVDIMHGQDYVHGDLRFQNIIYSG